MNALIQSSFFAFIVYLYVAKELIGKLDASNRIGDTNPKIWYEYGTKERNSSTGKLQICYQVSLKGILNRISLRLHSIYMKAFHTIFRKRSSL